MIGSQIIELESVESTNNYALQLINAGQVRHGTVVNADYQWGGRGRSNRKWDSLPGQNLTCSVILSPLFLPPGKQFRLSQAVALGVTDFLLLYAPGEQFQIKWPNDIIHGGSKIAGILIENLIFGSDFSWSVVGIGLNLNQVDFSPGIPAPNSLRGILGQELDVKAALLQLLSHLQNRYSELERGQIARIDGDYHARLYMLGEEADYAVAGGILRARSDGVDEYGRLLLTDVNGGQLAYMMDEVKLLR